MENLQDQLRRLGSFLAYADHDARNRAKVAGTVRQHAWSLMEARPRHKHSLELAIVDMDLLTAITVYETDDSAHSVYELRNRLREFHGAVAVTHHESELAAAA